jgi:hypothetical protein
MLGGPEQGTLRAAAPGACGCDQGRPGMPAGLGRVPGRWGGQPRPWSHALGWRPSVGGGRPGVSAGLHAVCGAPSCSEAAVPPWRGLHRWGMSVTVPAVARPAEAQTPACGRTPLPSRSRGEGRASPAYRGLPSGGCGTAGGPAVRCGSAGAGAHIRRTPSTGRPGGVPVARLERRVVWGVASAAGAASGHVQTGRGGAAGPNPALEPTAPMGAVW